MHCTQAQNQFDDYMDDMLPPFQREALECHLQTCHACSRLLQAEHDMLRHLRAVPVPPPSPGFMARALRQAGRNSRRRISFAAGAGSAIAAGLALWMIAGAWLAPKVPVMQVADVQLAVNRPQMVKLAFNTPAALDNVTLSLELPAGVYIEGRPGQRTVVWRDSLAKGRNVLKLDVVATQPASGDLIARVRHETQSKTFHIRLNAVAGKQQHTSVEHAALQAQFDNRATMFAVSRRVLS